MRVLWFAITPSLYNEKNKGSWIGALEAAVRKYCPNIELGIAFEHDDNNSRVVKNGVIYYPIKKFKNKWDFYKFKMKYDYEWYLLNHSLEWIISDFKPDIIHCFGSEWPYGKVVSLTKVPVVIHMQGFDNIYIPTSSMTIIGITITILLKYFIIRLHGAGNALRPKRRGKERLCLRITILWEERSGTRNL